MSVLARIAEAAGESAATKIAAEFGGRRLYVPARLPADHPLCRLVGFDAAYRIQRELGPGAIDVPLGRASGGDATRTAVQRMSEAGATARQIAERLGITMRTVYHHRAALREGSQ